MNAYQRIRRAQLRHERDVLKTVRESGGYFGLPLFSNVPKTTRNAIDRLVKKGKLKYSSFGVR